VDGKDEKSSCLQGCPSPVRRLRNTPPSNPEIPQTLGEEHKDPPNYGNPTGCRLCPCPSLFDGCSFSLLAFMLLLLIVSIITSLIPTIFAVAKKSGVVYHADNRDEIVRVDDYKNSMSLSDQLNQDNRDWLSCRGVSMNSLEKMKFFNESTLEMKLEPIHTKIGVALSLKNLDIRDLSKQLNDEATKFHEEHKAKLLEYNIKLCECKEIEMKKNHTETELLHANKKLKDWIECPSRSESVGKCRMLTLPGVGVTIPESKFVVFEELLFESEWFVKLLSYLLDHPVYSILLMSGHASVFLASVIIRKKITFVKIWAAATITNLVWLYKIYPTMPVVQHGVDGESLTSWFRLINYYVNLLNDNL